MFPRVLLEAQAPRLGIGGKQIFTANLPQRSTAAPKIDWIVIIVTTKPSRVSSVDSADLYFAELKSRKI